MNIPQPPNLSPIDGAIYFDVPWKMYFSGLASFLGGSVPSGELLPNYVNDAAAAAAGVPVAGYYRNGSVVMQRVV